MKSTWFKLALLVILQISLFAADWVVKDNRAFTLRNTSGTTGDNIFGDINVTGAPIMCADNGHGGCNWSYNDYLFNATGDLLTDLPTSSIHNNSSSAKLVIPADATITKAYLYWSGHIHGSQGTQNAYDKATSGYNSVIFQTPDGTNHTITADPNDFTKVNKYAYIIANGQNNKTAGFRLFYQAVSDVTDLINQGGYNPTNKNTFTVGNINVTPGADQGIYDPTLNADGVSWGPMGGWSLIVEYTRPIASGQAYKNVSIYDGFQLVVPPGFNQKVTTDVNIAGFLTPLTQVPTGTMAFYTMGSERKITGELIQMSNSSGTFNNVYNSANPVNSQLNDTVTTNGNQITSGRNFNPGIDLDTYEISTSCQTSSGQPVPCLDKNQKSTTLRFGIQAGSNTSDQSFPGMLALSMDIYQPYINIMKTTDSSTTVTPGKVITYYANIQNTGKENATNITVYDNFDANILTRTDGTVTNPTVTLGNLLDNNITKIQNSIICKYGVGNATTCPANSCSVTSSPFEISCKLPDLAVGATAYIQFQTTFKSSPDTSKQSVNVTNQMNSNFSNALTGEINPQSSSNIANAGTYLYVANPTTIDTWETTIPDQVVNTTPPITRNIYTKIVGKPATLKIASISTIYTPATSVVGWRIVDNTTLCSATSDNNITGWNDIDLTVTNPKTITFTPTKAMQNLRIQFAQKTGANYTSTSRQCSSDNFAVRPDRFVVSSSDPSFPYLLRSGKNYNATINAYNAGLPNTNTPNYNVTNASSIFAVSAANKYNRNGVNDTSMYGTLTFGTTSFDMKEGISFTSSGGNNVAGIAFDDVGKINVHIEDRAWAVVDATDGTPLNCTANGSYVCGDLNATFIPDHFDFNVATIYNNDGLAPSNQFTYLSNSIDKMAARIQTTVRALNLAGNVTKNFAPFPLWENNVTITPKIVKSTYLYPDANVSHISNQSIGFTAGVATINWNDTNSSKYLRFNFQRNTNQPANPFVVNPSDLNLSLSSPYYNNSTNTNDGSSPTNINGSKVGANSGNATFLYGRAFAPRYRFTGNTGNAKIFYESYCDSAGNKSMLPSGSIGDSSSVGWYLNVNHNAATDGNITAITEKNTPIKVTNSSALPLSSSGGSSTSALTYSGTTFPYKTTMQDTADSWLLYNPNNSSASKNDFEVEFYGGSNNWTGHSSNITTTDSVAAPVTSKRILW